MNKFMENKKYLCAIGDSQVKGAELVKTHYPDKFTDLSCNDYIILEYFVLENGKYHDEYNALIDSMRFSSIMANKLGFGYYNFAQEGASQEGIKLQAYFLTRKLKEDKVDLKDTVWMVGITSPWRQMAMNEMHQWTLNAEKWTSYGLDWVLSRGTGDSILFAQPGFNKGLSDQTTKEWLSVYSGFSILMSWVMHISDTVRLLRANGVQKIILPAFLWKDFRDSLLFLPEKELRAVTKIVTEFLNDNNLSELIVPDFNSFPDILTFTDLLNLPGNDKAWRCPGGHYNRDGHLLIADYLLQKYFNATTNI